MFSTRLLSDSSEPELAGSSVHYMTREVTAPAYRTVSMSPVPPPTGNVLYLVQGGTSPQYMQVLPSQLMPSQLMPAQVMPSQLMPAQVMPSQLMPTQVMPAQLMHTQMMPAQMVPAQVMHTQVVTNQVSAPTYVQKTSEYTVSSVEEEEEEVTDTPAQRYIEAETPRTPSVFSQSPSSVKSPVSFTKETEIVTKQNHVVHQEPVVRNVVEFKQQQIIETEPEEKLDTRFFGELLTEVYRKNCDIYSRISEHVAKIRGRKHLLDPTIDYKVDKEETDALIPRGVSELTKQQLRYLLQTRVTADKTLRLLHTTFSSLREELVHLQEDLRRLEGEKEDLEKDLSFKSDQALQYDRLLEAVRENNRQLQMSLKESSLAQQNLELQMLSSRNTDSDGDYRLKELEVSKRALEQENQMLRQKMAGQGSSSGFQVKTEELSKQYKEMLSSMRDEKDKEIQSLRSQLLKVKTEYTTQTTGDKSLELRITELLRTLEQRETVIKRQEEELKRFQQEKSDQKSNNVTRTIITKKYRNQYPILGLLSDDYMATSPVKEAKTIVIEKTGEMYKQEIITTP